MTFFLTIKDFSRFGGTNLSNAIMGFRGTGLTEEVTIGISNATGKLVFSRDGGQSKLSPISIVPTNGDSISNAHRRLEPITIAVVFDSTATNIKLYWTNDSYETLELSTDSFDIGDAGEFWIGAKTSTSKCNFYLKELLVTDTAMTSTLEITNVMEWLKYR
jgi:hypothetical protein